MSDFGNNTDDAGPAEHFLQPKITGYRQLSVKEASLMNDIKAVGAQFEQVFQRVREHLSSQRGMSMGSIQTDESMRLDDAEPGRWAAMGRTDAQTAVMKLVRAVAQPKS